MREAERKIIKGQWAILLEFARNQGCGVNQVQSMPGGSLRISAAQWKRNLRESSDGVVGFLSDREES
ncbi:hypothetical protein CU102_02820 [Phyllobacterium brassicacearum]|uniref:Uncharacterized protein n=1 Tax=Phyllobacterium brassicacearum TaxID=314235 RepID=A0A2P7BUA5_9HYPH|nr:hypothetical protein CU102_02820 [Phyllobacterium brassicacearum]